MVSPNPCKGKWTSVAHFHNSSKSSSRTPAGPKRTHASPPPRNHPAARTLGSESRQRLCSTRQHTNEERAPLTNDITVLLPLLPTVLQCQVPLCRQRRTRACHEPERAGGLALVPEALRRRSVGGVLPPRLVSYPERAGDGVAVGGAGGSGRGFSEKRGGGSARRGGGRCGGGRERVEYGDDTSEPEIVVD